MTVSKQSQDEFHPDSTCFGQPLCPSSVVLYCTFGTGKFHAGFWRPFPSRVRMSSILTLHVSGNLFAHHQDFSTVHSALVSFMQVFEDRFQAGSGWVPPWLCLEAVIKNLHETYQCRMYSRELLMMDKEVARNM